MKASDLRKLTNENSLGPVCISTVEVYSYLKSQAKAGLQNTFIIVPENKIYEIKKDLRDKGYRVYSNNALNSDHITQQELALYKTKNTTNADLYEIEIEW